MNLDLKTLIGSVAPTLATMLGGPLAGTAVSALASAFGLSPDASKDDITRAATAGMTPDVIAKVREADQRHQELMAQQQIDVKKLNDDYDLALAKDDVDDRVSARTSSVQGGTNRDLFWLSLILLAFSLGCEGYVLFVGYPKSVPDIVVGRVLGLMDSVTMMVLAFWYGTSSSSARKTELLSQAPAIASK
jgi:hypothetical protein